ncbi:Larval cuticle protein 9 [Lucilia cuprina]|uniref:Larval cuticle protein 9 n=1 Tax=Lucilia cuprina TaxID=7375 RepID=A0A0L0CA22_LUCCU|nr:larval cuticle protein 9 [Lucilia cuprina]XP_037819319.1 larval cuticle protein 9 [Lucilia sericata]KAI8119097.1 Larval cuticle protein 9 [Lucilia cuprina]KNC29278.1 Larval cuticle protein 9 [Lucilia cuprina]
MKFVIVLACLLAVAYANEDANILKSEQEVNVDSFHYALELDNTIKAIQEGHLKDKDSWLVSGEYEYVSKDGKHIKVTYTADELGYHPKVEQ